MYILKDKDGNTRVFTDEEIVNNAKQQAASGTTPDYRYFYGEHHGYSEPGYLVASMYSGCIVAIPHKNGNYQIIQSWQGDFVYGALLAESKEAV